MRKRKPKLIREQFPPVRVYEKDGKERYLIDARSKKRGINEQFWRTDKTDALNLAKEIANKAYVGEPLTKDEMRTFAHYREQFSKFDVRIERVLAEKLARLERNEDKEEGNKVLTANAADEWEKEKTSGETSKLRPATLREIKFTANALRDNWGQILVSSIKTEHIEEFLMGRKSKNGKTAALVTKRGWKVRLGVFFNWCWKKKKYIYGNPCATITYRIQATEPQIIEVKEVMQMFKLVEENERYCPLVNYLALGFFSGLRPFEIKRIKRENIVTKGEKPHLYLSGDVTKIRRARSILMNDALLSFMKAYPDQPILSANHVKLFAELRLELGYALRKKEGKPWEADAIRHTFASMHLAKHGKTDELATIMGNSPEVINAHYKRIVEPSVADAFWGIRPLKVVIDEPMKQGDVEVTRNGAEETTKA